MVHTIAAGLEDDDSQTRAGDVLLELEVLVSRDENREAQRKGPLQESAVLQASQSTCATVLREGTASSSASSTGSDSSTRTRTLGQKLASEFQGSHCLLSTHRRERTKKVLERIPGLEVVDEVLDRHAGSHEDGHSTHDLGVAVHDLGRAHVDDLPCRFYTPESPRTIAG